MTQQLLLPTPHHIEAITLDTTIDGYCREEGTMRDNAAAVSAWLDALDVVHVEEERIAVDIDSTGGEVNFTVTLREAKHLIDNGWVYFGDEVPRKVLEEIAPNIADDEELAKLWLEAITERLQVLWARV